MFSLYKYINKKVLILFISLGAVFALWMSVATAAIVPTCDVNCGFSDLIILAKNVIEFLLLEIAVPVAVIVFSYAGFLMLTARGNEEQVSRAKGMFWYVIIGLVIALSAWIIVKLITNTLLKPTVETFLG